MDGLQWKTLLKWDDLGVPLFLETPIWSFQFQSDVSVPSSRWQVYQAQLPSTQAASGSNSATPRADKIITAMWVSTQK